jgi:hypothetical protein
MRQILMTVLLIAVVVSLYANVVLGEEGMKMKIRDSGERMASEISRINP